MSASHTLLTILILLTTLYLTHSTDISTATNLINQYNKLIRPVAQYKECYDLPWNKFIEDVGKVELSYDKAHDKIKVKIGVKLALQGERNHPRYRASIWHQESGELFKEPDLKDVPEQSFDVAFFIEPGVLGNYEMTVRVFDEIPDREEMLCFDVPFKIMKDLREEYLRKDAVPEVLAV